MMSKKLKKTLDKAKTDLSVGEVAQRTGVAVSAIHFYEEKGLIWSRRNSGNQRRFCRGTLRRIGVIKVAQKLGIPLASIKRALTALPKTRIATDDDWGRLSDRWRKELDERIESMIRLRDQLDKCIGCGCLSTKSCPLRNPNDELSKKGQGAVLLS